MSMAFEGSRFKDLFRWSSDSKIEKWGSSYFIPLGTVNNIFNGSDFLLDFMEVPEVNAIINIRARALSSWILSVQSKTTKKEVPSNESLVRVLKAPNWFQGQGEFWKQSSLFHDIWGNEYLYFLRPVGMPNTNKGMFTLDPARVTVKFNTKNPFFLEPTGDAVEYFYDLGNGRKLPLDKTALIHLNDNRVQTNLTTVGTAVNDSTNFLTGTSKLKALQPAIQNIRAAYKKRNISLTLPTGVFSNGQNDALGQSIPMSPDEKDKAQLLLRTHGALPIFTNLHVKYDEIRVNARNMGLFEETREDTGRICDAYGVPFELLASQKGVTFTNLKEAKKQMYEETIIPDAQEKIDALNLNLQTDKKAWQIVASYSHLPVFAEDLKTRAETLNTMIDVLDKLLAATMITTDQYKAELQKFGL